MVILACPSLSIFSLQSARFCFNTGLGAKNRSVCLNQALERGFSDQSLVFGKFVFGPTDPPARMPLDGQLLQADLDIIYDWIFTGARTDCSACPGTTTLSHLF